MNWQINNTLLIVTIFFLTNKVVNLIWRLYENIGILGLEISQENGKHC